MNTKQHIGTPLFTRTALSLFVALSSSMVYAQTATKTPDAAEEVIVTGVRKALESAVDVKRNTDAVVDHISADDIVGFPARDLGETLQQIPGIQVNRDSERRQSEVSMRGLGGGYVLQLAEGQEFANPTRSQGNTAPSPFGAFEGGVFNGVTVYKSQQANLVEGGIAGVVDKKLPNAFAKKTAGFSVSATGRYEELGETTDPEVSMGGNTYLIDDKLAVAGKVAYSGQNFREDTLVVPQWSNVETISTAGVRTTRLLVAPTGTAAATETAAYNAWKNSFGIVQNTANFRDPATDIILTPSQVRQISEVSGGERMSFTGNIALQATDELKLDMDILYTKRVLDQNEFENFIVNPNSGTAKLRALSDPIKVFNVGDVNYLNTVETKNTWIINDISFENANIETGNRVFNFNEQTQGVFLGAEWENGPLKIEVNATASQAQNIFNQVQMTNRIGSTPGINGELRMDGTNLDEFSLSIPNVAQFDLLGPPGSYGTYNSATNSYSVYSTTGVLTPLVGVPGALQRSTTINGVRPLFAVSGNSQEVARDLATFDMDGIYQLDMPFIKSVQAGIRFTKDNLDANFLQHTLEDTAVDLISSDLKKYPAGGTSTPFFGGKLDGVASASPSNPNGWMSLDVFKTLDVLKSRGITPTGNQELTQAGLIASLGTNLNTAGQNFESGQNTGAIFLMANLNEDLGFATLTGNIGVRHVGTDITAYGIEVNQGTTGTITSATPLPFVRLDNNYSHTLPSLNLGFSFLDDYKVRFAANKAITRPNLKGLKPVTTFGYTDDTAGDNNSLNINLPDSQVKPFEAVSMDVVFEWYNRPGSNLAVGIFSKDFKGQFKTATYCPSSFQLRQFDLELELEGDGTCRINNPFYVQLGTGTAALLEPITKLNLNRKINDPSTQMLVGVEISATQNFDFLPGIWGGFGFKASYTNLENQDDGKFYNVSPESGSFTGYWENDIVTVQFTSNYRSEYQLPGGGTNLGVEDRENKPRTQHDLTITYSPMKNLKLTAQAFNLTDEQLLEYDYRSDLMLRRARNPGRTYALKGSYSF